MEAQEDQHDQARPELAGHVENMENYDTVLNQIEVSGGCADADCCSLLSRPAAIPCPPP